MLVLAAADGAGTCDIVCGWPSASRQSRTALYRLLARLMRWTGAKDPTTGTSPTLPSTGTIALGGTHPPG
jgi:hypothetical protein